MQPGGFLKLVVALALPGLLVAGTGTGGEGDCMEGWVDGRSVGLGCLLADQTTQQLNYPQAEAACKNYGETGRLIEITSQEQMSFVQSYLAEVEAEWGEPEDGPGFRWWWLGLNDIQVEGEFVWPVSGPATFTYWDVEYEEPYPDPEHERNCHAMQSAMFNLLWITYWCEDGYDMVALC